MNSNEWKAWETISMYCPNCATLNNGYRDKEGKIKFQCTRCKMVMVRSYKNRRHDIIEVTIPQGMERLRASNE